jgi:NAD(P)-dependent dehydrogenase (short-subunit alcohol dehydrogenase family)
MPVATLVAALAAPPGATWSGKVCIGVGQGFSLRHRGRARGLAITTALVNEGVTVVAGARTAGADLPALEATGAVIFVPVDLSTAAGPAALIARATELGGLDILVNNAGAVTPRPGGFATVTDEDWAASLNLTLMAAVRTTRAALPQLQRRGGGCIVTISSVNPYLPDRLVIDYSAAKAALTNFSKSLSKEVAPIGIRMNTISPGPVATELWLGPDGVGATVAAARGRSAEEVAAGAAAQSVTGRFTRPEEVADLVLILASDRTANITGTDFSIDGGLVETL